MTAHSSLKLTGNSPAAPLLLNPPPMSDIGEYLVTYMESFHVKCSIVISDPSVFEYLLWRRPNGMKILLVIHKLQTATCLGATSSLITSESIVRNLTGPGSTASDVQPVGSGGSGSGTDELVTVSVLLDVTDEDGGIQCSDAGQYECIAGFNEPQIEAIGINITIEGEKLKY